MKNNWISEQIIHNVSQWDTVMENKYPEVKKWNKDSKKYFKEVCEKCNYYDNVRNLNWEKYLVKSTKALDLGCGGGWLSSYLSKYKEVEVVYSMDTSKNYLYNIFPGVLDIMDGNKNKIKIIEGMFTPLLIEDNSLDLVVASAALHHADNLQFTLEEISRKLKPGGFLIILNETPSAYIKYILRILRSFSKILISSIFKRYYTVSQKISSGNLEYDPWLGDKTYPFWYWENAINNSGFELCETVDTNMPTVKGMKQESLKHFICRKVQ